MGYVNYVNRRLQLITNDYQTTVNSHGNHSPYSWNLVLKTIAESGKYSLRLIFSGNLEFPKLILSVESFECYDVYWMSFSLVYNYYVLVMSSGQVFEHFSLNSVSLGQENSLDEQLYVGTKCFFFDS